MKLILASIPPLCIKAVLCVLCMVQVSSVKAEPALCGKLTTQGKQKDKVVLQTSLPSNGLCTKPLRSILDSNDLAAVVGERGQKGANGVMGSKGSMGSPGNDTINASRYAFHSRTPTLQVFDSFARFHFHGDHPDFGFSPFATEIGTLLPTKCNLTNLSVKLPSNLASGLSYTFTLFVEGAATSVTCSIPGNQLACSSSAVAMNIDKGSMIHLQSAVTPLSSGPLTSASFSITCEEVIS
jgi:hypothetical protein